MANEEQRPKLDLAPSALLPHGALGVYQPIRRLGQGGMGEVFLAFDERLKRQVAIKRILTDPPPSAASRARFRREAQAVARLSHPSIVQVFELFESPQGEDCLVMEYVEGRGLSECIAEGRLKLDHTLRLAAEVALGLAEAHGKGLVHRDLKPDNIRITESEAGVSPGHAKILDFGLARLLWSDGLDSEAMAETVTRSGALIGTVHAMSPEQAGGRDVDHRSDLFALGSLLYEMLTGFSPFRGANVLDTLRRITSEEATPLSERRPGLSSQLVDLVEGLMQKDPTARPQNARLVAQALTELQNTGGEIEPTSRPTRPDGSARGAAVQDGGGLGDQLTGELPNPANASPFEPAIRTLASTYLLGLDSLLEFLGKVQGTQVLERHARLARDLLARYGGFEIGSGQGFQALFERPMAAVAWALDYQRGVQELSTEAVMAQGDRAGHAFCELEAKVGLHLGEVLLRRNSAEDVSRGAKVLEVVGQASSTVERVLDLAEPRQVLMTQGIFDLARRVLVEDRETEEGVRWLAHGGYQIRGMTEALEIFEVGMAGFAPLAAPVDSEEARRTVTPSGEHLLGWRPASGQAIPRRPNWSLTSRLGEGGFGEVWLATHTSGEQRVFKFCFETQKLRALKREATLFRLIKEALGQRDDIARVLDWNFDAAPYFLEVEHTEGGDLVAWAEQQGGLVKLPLAQRLELAAQVADALSAAHSVGVLHQDVKPENVLIRSSVAAQNAPKHRVRLTDFGVGALLDPSRLEAEGVTAMGFTQTLTSDSSVVGTRRYLAPEVLDGKPATVQADLYAFGVLLYQLAVGDLSRHLTTGWQRDLEDPLLIDDIARLVDGDPARRPSSAESVAVGLRALERRHGERRQGQLRARRRRQMRLVGLVAAGLLVTISALLVQSHRARQQALGLQERAEVAREQAEGLVGFMLGDLQQQLQAMGRLDALEGAGEKALEYFEGLDAVDRRPATVARHAKALHQMGDVKMAQGDLDGALQLFERSLAQTEDLASRNPDDLNALFELGQSHFWVAAVHWRQGDLEQALARAESYLELSEELASRQPEKAAWRLEVLAGHNNLVDLHGARQNPGLALEHGRQAVRLGESLLELDGQRTDWRFETSMAFLRLGNLELEQGELQAALGHQEASRDLLLALTEDDPESARWRRHLATARERVASTRFQLGDLQEAADENRRQLELLESLHQLEPDHREWRELLALAHGRYGKQLGHLGRMEDAGRHVRQALATIDSLAVDPSSVWDRRYRATIHCLAAGHFRASGQTEPALNSARVAAEILSPLVEHAGAGPTDLRLWIDSQLAWGYALKARGKGRDAYEHFTMAREALDRLPELHPIDRWRAARAHLALDDIDAAQPHLYALLGLGFRHPQMAELFRRAGLEVPPQIQPAS